MAENEKCFCHLNGLAVKDAAARKQIEEIMRDYPFVMNSVIAFSQLAEDPENEGKVIGIMGEQIVVMDAPAVDTSELEDIVAEHGIDIAANTAAIENVSGSVSQHGTQINGIISEQQQHAAKIAKNTTDIANLQLLIEQLVSEFATELENVRTYVDEQIALIPTGSGTTGKATIATSVSGVGIVSGNMVKEV